MLEPGEEPPHLGLRQPDEEHVRSNPEILAEGEAAARQAERFLGAQHADEEEQPHGEHVEPVPPNEQRDPRRKTSTGIGQ